MSAYQNYTLEQIRELYGPEEDKFKEFIEKKLDGVDKSKFFSINEYNKYKWLFFLENHNIYEISEYFKKYFLKCSYNTSPTIKKIIYESIELDDLKNIIVKELNKIICKNTEITKIFTYYPADQYININYYEKIIKELNNEESIKKLEDILKYIITALQTDNGARFKNLFI